MKPSAIIFRLWNVKRFHTKGEQYETSFHPGGSLLSQHLARGRKGINGPYHLFKGIPSALHGAILTGQRADQHLRQRRSYPKIVGSKRIERAIARWKADPQIMTEAQSFANEAAADQRDLLVISQSMTIAWLEKKVMDLQDQLRSMEAHAAECLNAPSPGKLVTLA